MKKSQNVPVWLSKLVVAQHCLHKMLRLANGTAVPNTFF
jgi:hypothetical protein